MMLFEFYDTVTFPQMEIVPGFNPIPFPHSQYVDRGDPVERPTLP